MIEALNCLKPYKNSKTPLLLPQYLQEEIKSFALSDNLDLFTSNGDSRRFCNLNNFDIDLTHKIKIFADRCYNELGIFEYSEEPYFGNFIGVNSTKGFVHQHIDPSPSDHWHVRINFFVQKPQEGGDIIINKILINNINECESWLNFANVWEHGSTPVQGPVQRIVLSLGAVIHDSNASRLYTKLPYTL